MAGNPGGRRLESVRLKIGSELGGAAGVSAVRQGMRGAESSWPWPVARLVVL